MDQKGALTIEGLDEVLRGFDRAEKRVRQAAFVGLQKGAMNIIADAKVNLRNNGSVVTGLLRSSGKVQKTGEYSLDAGFFDTKNMTGYAAYVEYGRSSGKMPPPDELEQWAYKKFQMKDRKAARAAGWAMAVRIAEKGTKPHPFFQPAVKANTRSIIEAVRAAINKETR